MFRNALPPLVTSALFTVVACSGPRHMDRPTGTGAVDQRQAAQTHAGLAGAEEARDPREAGGGRGLTGGSSGGVGSRVGEAAALSAAARAFNHRQHAHQHIARAEALEAFEFGACLNVRAEQRTSCPLGKPSVIIERTARGLRVTAGNGAEASDLAAHIRCHHAFGTTHGFAGMQSCPLYVDDIIVTENQGGTIDINGRDRASVEELWLRAFGTAAGSTD